MATWNVRTLFRAGALQNLMSQLEKYSLDIIALQEIRWKGSDTLRSRKYTLFYSGNNTNTLGTAFAVRNDLLGAVMDFQDVSERMCTLRIKARFFNITIICVHAPTEETEDAIKDAYYDQLEEVYDAAPRHDVKIIMGDLNAKIGREDVFRSTIGKESLHMESNDNGLRVIDFAISKGMSVVSTTFPHKNIHKATWRSPDGKTHNQIDHILVDIRHASDVMDVRSLRGADADSDHFLVRMKYRQRISCLQSRKNPRVLRFDCSKLRDLEVREEYSRNVQQHLRIEVAARDNDIELEESWISVKSAIKQAAEKTIGYRRQEQREAWFDDECKEAIEARNMARQRMLERETRKNAAEFSRARTVASHICRRKKRELERKKVMEIEEMAKRKEIREMYGLIKEEKRGFQARTTMIRDVDGSLLADPKAVLDRWANHFEQLLNRASESSTVVGCESVPMNNTQVSEPREREVEEAIKTLKNNKAPGEDLINAELFKYGGNSLKLELHSLICKIWQQEKMPTEWETALICPIHKKGSKTDCAKYRGICLLNVAYKILTKVIAKRLEPFAESIIGDYQCGFRSGRSTTDQIFTIRNIMEKCYEYNIPVHQLFVDYKEAYDSIERPYLFETLHVLGVPAKLVRLVEMTLKKTRGKISLAGAKSREFNVARGLRQGDALSCMLFNLTLERVIRKIEINPGGTLLNRTVQYLAYADDLDILSRNERGMKEALEELTEESLKAGLCINKDKTKYMLMNRAQRSSVNQIMVGRYSFENVACFKYLGSILTENNETLLEIKERIKAGNKAYFSLQHLLKSRLISRRSKKSIYRTVLRPIVMYASETWVMTRRDETMLNTWERKVLRRIYGPVREEDGWRIRTNTEVYEMYKEPSIVTEIKRARLRWLGHLERMPAERTVKKVYSQKPEGRRLPGCPRKRWLDDVEDDIREMGVRGWRRRARDRNEWKRIVEAAKALHGP